MDISITPFPTIVNLTLAMPFSMFGQTTFVTSAGAVAGSFDDRPAAARRATL